MGYSSEVRKKSIDTIKERKLSAERNADYRRDMIFEKIPEAREYERKIASCAIKAGRTVIRGGDVKKELEKLKDESLKLQLEYETLLKENGFSTEDMEPDYTCKKCNDKGFIEENNRSVMCSCLKKVLVETACAQLNKNSPLSLCTFEDFDLGYYPKVKASDKPRSSYEQLSGIFKYCKSYAENFTPKSESIFMIGMTGLGKTHLSLAIANEVIKRGYGVIYVTAPALVTKLEKEQFSRNKDNNTTEQTLTDCDLLIVDDLGTEFTTQFTSKALYNVFNARLLLGKPVIINTNLGLDKIQDIYSERFVSRIIGEAKRLNFFGDDVRIKKKNKV